MNVVHYWPKLNRNERARRNQNDSLRHSFTMCRNQIELKIDRECFGCVWLSRPSYKKKKKTHSPYWSRLPADTIEERLWYRVGHYFWKLLNVSRLKFTFEVGDGLCFEHLVNWMLGCWKPPMTFRYVSVFFSLPNILFTSSCLFSNRQCTFVCVCVFVFVFVFAFDLVPIPVRVCVCGRISKEMSTKSKKVEVVDFEHVFFVSSASTRRGLDACFEAPTGRLRNAGPNSAFWSLNW